MTTTVTIAHDGPLHNVVKVITMEVDEDGGATSGDFTILNPGDSVRLPVFPSQSILIEEGGIVRPTPEEPEPVRPAAKAAATDDALRDATAE